MMHCRWPNIEKAFGLDSIMYANVETQHITASIFSKAVIKHLETSAVGVLSFREVNQKRQVATFGLQQTMP